MLIIGVWKIGGVTEKNIKEKKKKGKGRLAGTETDVPKTCVEVTAIIRITKVLYVGRVL